LRRAASGIKGVAKASEEARKASVELSGALGRFQRMLETARQNVASWRAGVRAAAIDTPKLTGALGRLQARLSGVRQAAAEATARIAGLKKIQFRGSTSEGILPKEGVPGSLDAIKAQTAGLKILQRRQRLADELRELSVKRRAVLENRLTREEEVKREAFEIRISAIREGNLRQVILRDTEARRLREAAEASIAGQRAETERRIAARRQASQRQVLLREVALARVRRRQQTFRRRLQLERGQVRNAKIFANESVRASRASAKAAKTAKAQEKALEGSANQAGLLAFSLRSLFRAFIVFGSIRLVVDTIRSAFRAMVEFNSVLEQARIGAAALVVATGEVRDSTGNLVGPARGFQLALEISRKQLELLRRDSLRTVATFEQLTRAFQVSVAPGLEAGLNLDEIREFSVRISQAAAALGLKQTELAEEIRSLLRGTIQIRTTRIAAALGITNEDIKEAREAGVLVAFLREQFQAFEEAGGAIEKTFEALFTNLVGAVRLLLGTGAVDFFDEIKELLGDTFKLFVQEGSLSDVLEPNPRALAVVKAISAALRDLVKAAGEALRSFTFEETTVATQLLIDLINGLSFILKNVIAEFVSGFLKGLGVIRTAFSVLESIRKKIVELGSNLEELPFGSILGNAKGILGVTESTFAEFVNIAGILSAIVVSFKIIASLVSTKLLLPVLAVATAITVLKKGVDSIVGRTNTLTQSVTLFVNAFLFGIRKIIRGNKILFFNAQIEFNKFILDITQGFGSVRKAIFSIVGAFNPLAGAAASALGAVEDVHLEGLRDDIKFFEQRIAAIAKEGTADRLKTDDAATRILLQDQTATESIVESLGKLLGDEFAGALKETTDNLGLKEAFNVSPIVESTVAALKKQEEQVKKIRDEAKKLQDSLDLVKGVRNQEGIFKRLAEIRITGDQKQRDVSESLQKQLQQLRKAEEEAVLRATKARAEANASDLASLDVIIKSVQRRNKLEIQLQDAINQTVIARLKAADAEQKSAPGDEVSNLRAVEKQTKAALSKIETLVKASRARVSNFFDQLGKPGNEEFARLTKRTLEAVRDQKAALDGIEKTKIAISELEAGGIANIRLQNALFLQQNSIQERRRQLEQSKALSAEEEKQKRLRNVQDKFKNRSFSDVFLGGREEATTRAKAQENIAILEDDLKASNRRILDDIQELGEKRGALVSELPQLQGKEREATLRNIEAISENTADLDLKRLNNQSKITAEIKKQEEVARNVVDTWQELFDSLDTAPATFQIIFQLIQTFAQNLANTLSTLILDALDPNKKVDLRERFKTFFQGIARLLLQTLLQRAIIAAIARIGGALAGAGAGGVGFSQGGAIGRAEGGSIPNSPAPASVRPSGLHATDRVPIWATAGEHMIRRSSASMYGHDVLDRINKGLVDPTSLRSLAGMRSRRKGFRSGGPVGYQSGGAVSPRASGQSPGTNAAFIVANDQAMDRLLTGGKAAMLRFLRQNRNDFAPSVNRRSR